MMSIILGIGLAALTLFSCSNKESLQRYIVDRQDDDSFLKIDIAASLLQTDSANLSQEEKDILKKHYLNQNLKQKRLLNVLAR